MSTIYNKVVLNNEVLMDISSDTVTADKVLSGYTGHDASGQAFEGTYVPSEGGSGSVITVVETADENGGTIKDIVAVDISSDTVDAAHLAQGYTAHNAAGEAITGTMSSESSSTPEITVATDGAVSQALEPDTIYHFTSTALTSLTITFSGDATDQYHFDFISPSTAATLSLPASVSMETGFSVEVNTRYEIDIFNNYGVFAEWVVSS